MTARYPISTAPTHYISKYSIILQIRYSVACISYTDVQIIAKRFFKQWTLLYITYVQYFAFKLVCCQCHDKIALFLSRICQMRDLYVDESVSECLHLPTYLFILTHEYDDHKIEKKSKKSYDEQSYSGSHISPSRHQLFIL